MASPELTPELIQAICTNVTAGMMPRAAAALAGVDRQDFAEWMRRAKKGMEPYLTMASEIDKATLNTQRRVLANVTVAATKDPKIGMQFLAMRFPEDFSERRETSVQIEVESRSADEIKQLATRMAGRFPLLHWESRDEFEQLITGLLVEHQPHGPTEEHLVEELAAIVQSRNPNHFGRDVPLHERHS